MIYVDRDSYRYGMPYLLIYMNRSTYKALSSLYELISSDSKNFYWVSHDTVTYSIIIDEVMFINTCDRMLMSCIYIDGAGGTTYATHQKLH